MTEPASEAVPEGSVELDDGRVDVAKAQLVPARSIAETREDVRGLLAKSLTLLLAAVVLGAGGVLIVAPDRLAVMSEFLKIVFTPLVGLVGSAIGFYFGSHADERERSGTAAPRSRRR